MFSEMGVVNPTLDIIESIGTVMVLFGIIGAIFNRQKPFNKNIAEMGVVVGLGLSLIALLVRLGDDKDYLTEYLTGAAGYIVVIGIYVYRIIKRKKESE